MNMWIICSHKWIKRVDTLRSSAQWAKTWKKFQFQMCVWVVASLSQRLKSTFFLIFFLIKIFSKNVDFSLWGNRATTKTHIWNWNFFHVLAHFATVHYSFKKDQVSDFKKSHSCHDVSYITRQVLILWGGAWPLGSNYSELKNILNRACKIF